MRENNNQEDMLEIMREIGLDASIKGIQRRELYKWAWYKCHYNPSAIYLDVGTNMGNSAIVLASALKHQNIKIPAKVYTVDNYSKSRDSGKHIEQAKKNMSSFGIDHLLSVHIGDAEEFVSSLPDGSIDMVFDDAGHSYSGTLKRLRAYVPKMNKNSLICAHDYYINFVSIVKAVEVFRAEYKDILTGFGGIPGMFWMFCKVEV